MLSIEQEGSTRSTSGVANIETMATEMVKLRLLVLKFDQGKAEELARGTM